MPGAVTSPMARKLPLVGFGPCHRATPSWVDKDAGRFAGVSAPAAQAQSLGEIADIRPATATPAMLFNYRMNLRLGPLIVDYRLDTEHHEGSRVIMMEEQ